MDNYSSYAYGYDEKGRLRTLSNAGTAGVPGVVFTYGYDPVNNLTSVTDAINGQQAGTELFQYDALNRVERVEQFGNNVAQKRVDFAYDAASQMESLTRYADRAGNDLVASTDYNFDLAGRLTSLTHRQGQTALAGYGFQYDAANRLQELNSSLDGVSTYTYNDRGELEGAAHAAQGNEAYVYDDNGNRLNAGYNNDPNNQLQSDGTYTYLYDDEGNRTRRTEIATGELTRYEWDHRNRLIEITTEASDGTVLMAVDYVYDAFDRRIEKTVDADGDGTGTAETERFVYDGAHIAMVFDGGGNLTQRFLHGPRVDQVLAQEDVQKASSDPSRVLWALSDHQGSVRDVVDNDGTVVNHIVYDSFGNTTSETNPGVDFRFSYTGRELDEETGQYFYRARYYDAENAQFISEDPIGFAAGDANLNRYVGNSPTNFTDPSGLQTATFPGGGALQGAGNALRGAGNALRVGGNALRVGGAALLKGGGALLRAAPGAAAAVLTLDPIMPDRQLTSGEAEANAIARAEAERRAAEAAADIPIGTPPFPDQSELEFPAPIPTPRPQGDIRDNIFVNPVNDPAIQRILEDYPTDVWESLEDCLKLPGFDLGESPSFEDLILKISNPYRDYNDSQLIRARRSYEALIAEHLQKQADYIQNPDAYDNQGNLRNAKTPNIREKIIQGRIRALQKQLDKQQGELDKIEEVFQERGIE